MFASWIPEITELAAQRNKYGGKYTKDVRRRYTTEYRVDLSLHRFFFESFPCWFPCFRFLFSCFTFFLFFMVWFPFDSIDIVLRLCVSFAIIFIKLMIFLTIDQLLSSMGFGLVWRINPYDDTCIITPVLESFLMIRNEKQQIYLLRTVNGFKTLTITLLFCSFVIDFLF